MSVHCCPPETVAGESHFGARPRGWWGAAAVAALVTLLAYLPLMNNGFTNWDDPFYLLLNDAVKNLSVESFHRFFTSFQLDNYHPLALLALAVEHRLFGLDALPYHAVSLFLHLMSTVLVLYFARALGAGLRAATVASLLFGLHPLHVESVAWVAEQKDLLCAVFFLATLVIYARAPDRDGRRAWVGIALVTALLALLAKPMAVSLPLVLVLIDRLRGRRIDRRALVEKAPFLLLAAGSALLTLAAQREGMRIAGDQPVWHGMFVASHGILFYIAKALVPIRLSALYPHPALGGGPLPTAFLLAPLGLVLAGSAVAWLGRWSRLAGFCALYFLVTILPVLQIIPVGFAHAADRYFYIPSVGVLVLAGAGWDRLARSVSHRWTLWLLTAAIAILLAMAALTWRRIGVWRDGVTIWDDVLAHYPRSAVALWNRGSALAAYGEADRALADYNSALGLGGAPTMRSRIVFDRGRIRNDRGELLAAIGDYTEALRLDPGYAEALVNRGNALDAAGRPDAAIADYTEALRFDPDNDLARYNRGITLRAGGDLARALADFDAALRLNPWHAASWFNRAVVRAELGQFPAALEDFNRAVILRPGDAETFQVRGQVRRRLGDERGAREDQARAEELGPRPSRRQPVARPGP